ncbi:hypothetical protein C2C43_13945 [Escherichia coli]|nr:hypothetical protein [Escherichia coli]
MLNCFLIIISPKEDSYILKILLRFDDDLIKNMKEGFARLNTNPFQNHQEFSLINNIRITLIHFLLEDFHYEP